MPTRRASVVPTKAHKVCSEVVYENGANDSEWKTLPPKGSLDPISNSSNGKAGKAGDRVPTPNDPPQSTAAGVPPGKDGRATM